MMTFIKILEDRSKRKKSPKFELIFVAVTNAHRNFVEMQIDRKIPKLATILKTENHFFDANSQDCLMRKLFDFFHL